MYNSINTKRDFFPCLTAEEINLISYALLKLSLFGEGRDQEKNREKEKLVTGILKKLDDLAHDDSIHIKLSGMDCYRVSSALEIQSFDRESFIDEEDEQEFEELQKSFYAQWYHQDKNVNANWAKPDETPRV